jgi:hypothetical protein
VRGDVAARCARRLEALRERDVQVAPDGPRHVHVQRLARERVPERARAGRLRALTHHARVEQLREAVGAGQRRDEREVEFVAAHRRHLGGAAAGLGELRRPNEDGIAHGLWQRHLIIGGEREPGRGRGQRTAHAQRGRELLDEERDALGAIVDDVGQRRRRPVAEGAGQQLGRGLRLERP